ncbi:MarR family winged helix-turn-helix transcriptional regulator [Actinocorallia longicatena]|uniref:MarR family winged helix-turn-helix transcriptional regulator n=1 Tax=Actinocorallia longicatena TaxID=111803 RepID=UPI0031DB75E7
MTVPGITHDLPHLLTLVERRMAGRLSATLQAFDLTIEEYRILVLLADGAGHAMSEIADYTLVPAPTLTKVVDRMVASTLVYRRPDAEDRRRVLVFLADRGRERHTAAAEAVAAGQAAFEAALGPEETALLTVLLSRTARLP